MSHRTSRTLLAALALGLVAAAPALGQDPVELGSASALQEHHPALFSLVSRLERAHAVLFQELAREGDVVRGGGSTEGFAVKLTDRLTRLVAGEDTMDERDGGYEALGARGSEIVHWGQTFQREVLSILADPEIRDRRAALADAVDRYRSRPEAALPSVPKNMEILYGHPYALDFRNGYGDLDGLVWAGHWLRLAATEPLTDLDPGAARLAGIDTVTARYHAKLSYGEPPHSFPTEIPLAPAIAPGLIWLSPESAIIWDNLSMLLEVLGDALASPEATEIPQTIQATIDFFMDPGLAVTDRDEWEIMALRHGIFFQGGFPLSVMTGSERNVGGHAAHLSGGRTLMTIPGMPIG